MASILDSVPHPTVLETDQPSRNHWHWAARRVSSGRPPATSEPQHKPEMPAAPLSAPAQLGTQAGVRRALGSGATGKQTESGGLLGTRELWRPQNCGRQGCGPGQRALLLVLRREVVPRPSEEWVPFGWLAGVGDACLHFLLCVRRSRTTFHIDVVLYNLPSSLMSFISWVVPINSPREVLSPL